MFCSECGNEIKGNKRFCPKCGTPTKFEQIAAQDVCPEEFEIINGKESSNQNAEAKNSIKDTPVPFPQATMPKATTFAPRDEEFGETESAEKPFYKKWIVVGGIVAILIALGGAGFYYFAPNLMNDSPGEHFVSLSKGEFDKAYSQLDVKESAWITKENFKKYVEWAKANKIGNYKVLDKTLEDVKVKYKEEKDGKMVYKLVAKASGDNTEHTIIVTKNKDNSKIIPDCVSKLELELPKGSVVEVDGKTVEEKSKEKGLSSYVIDALFYGPHKIKISHELLDSYEKDIVLNQNESFDKDAGWTKRVVKPGYEPKVEQAALDYINKVVAAAFAKKDAKDSGLVFNEDPKLIEMHGKFSNYFSGKSGSDIENIKAESGKLYSISSEETGIVKCQYIYDGTYTKKAVDGKDPLKGKFNGTIQVEMIPMGKDFEVQKLNSYNVHIMKAR